MSHNEIYDWLYRSFIAIKPEDVTNAFLASLSTRRLDWRSALGSYAIASNFPQHSFHATKNEYICPICGFIGGEDQEIDLSVMNFERYKWGGVRHVHPEYIAFDLEQFAKINKPTPSLKDMILLEKIFEAARKSEATSRPRDLEKRLSDIIESNIQEREVLIQILGYCGILQPRDKPSYFQGFVNYNDRVTPPVNKIDWTYPVSWWRGQDGVNHGAIKHYFPYLSA
jgi:hypothetical protein